MPASTIPPVTDQTQGRADDGGGMAGIEDPGKEFRAAQGIPIIPSLDGFRAFAILGIVALHLAGAYLTPLSSTERLITYGILPNFVDILFILSGFVVFLPTVARHGDFGRVGPYAIRRAARLMPAFWLAIVVTVALILLWPASPAPAFPSASSLGLHAIAMHQPAGFLDADFVTGLGINGPMWTLSLEVTFYLLLPLIASLYFRHPLIGLALACLITVGWKVGAENIADVARFLGFEPSAERLTAARLSAMGQFPAWAFHFGLGMTAAWALVRLRERRAPEWLAKRAAWVQAGALLALVPLLYQFGTFAETGNPLAPTIARTDILLTLAIPAAIAAFMLATALAPRRLQAPFAAPRVRRLGDISYGIYLIHFPAILFVGALIGTSDSGLADALTHFWILALIVIVISVAYGYLSGRYLEQPIRRWAHRFGRRAEKAPPPSEPAPISS